MVEKNRKKLIYEKPSIFTGLVEENQKTLTYAPSPKNCNEKELIYKYINRKILFA